mgnify:FL=1
MIKIIGGLVGLIIMLCLIEKFVFGDDKNDGGIVK